MKSNNSALSHNVIILLLLGMVAIIALFIPLPSHSHTKPLKTDSAYMSSTSFIGEPGRRYNDPKTVLPAVKTPPATFEFEVAPESQGALPNILFLGAQKAGSTSISTWLFNGGVCRADTFADELPYFSKESHFFDKDDRFDQGVGFYAKRFQHCLDEGNEFIMDATPDYLTFPERISEIYLNNGADALSKLKLMVVLREPISRELSWYNHKYFFANSHGGGTTFEKHSSLLLHGKPDPHWASTGKYVDHLKKFASFVDRGNILVLSYDELKSDPEKAQWRIRQFLGGEFPGELSMLNTHDNPNKLREVSPRARRLLEPFFRDKNEELYEFLEMNPGPWMEQRPFPRFVLESQDERDVSTVFRRKF